MDGRAIGCDREFKVRILNRRYLGEQERRRKKERKERRERERERGKERRTETKREGKRRFIRQGVYVYSLLGGLYSELEDSV